MKLNARSITKVSSLITAIIGLIISISIPAAYFIISYQYVLGAVNTEMAFTARSIEGLINSNPKSWQFEEIRLQEILERDIDDAIGDNRIIRDLHGRVIAQERESLARPVLTFSQSIYDSGIEVAHIEIQHSIASIVIRTAFISAGSVLLGIIIFFLFRFLPLRAIRKAYDQLQESEKQYRLITEKMSDIVWIADMNLRVIYVTPSVQKLLGFTQEERIQKTVEEQFTPDSLSYGLEVLARELTLEAQGNGDPNRTVTLVMEHYHQDGSTRWMETTIGGLRNDQGVLNGLHGVSRDVTERVRTEKQLRESEKRYRRITDNMSDLVSEADAQSIFTYVSPSHLKIVGYAPEELLGRPVFENVHPEDLERLIIGGDQGVRRGEEREVEYRYRHKDGHYVWLRSIGRSLQNAKGEHIGAVMSSSDITERKQAVEALRASEEHYRTIFESTATANVIIDEDTTIIMVNNDFITWSGYAKQELEGKMSWATFIHPDNLERVKSYDKMRTLHPESVPASYEFLAINRKGEVKNLYVSVAVIPGTKERIVSISDLTEKKQLETQLVQSQKMESVGRLAGGVAHDFNNMLSVIIGHAEMAMRRVANSDPIYKSLHEILNAGTRSGDLTRQLLAFARKQTISPKVLDLNDTVTGMLKMLQRLIGEDIKLTWNPVTKPWRVKIDPSQIDQILANLMVNARDAIEKTGRITIETSNVACDEAYCKDRPEWIPGDYVLLSVSDSGCGMEKELLSNIFEPFFTTKKEGQGTGLGLATVYGIVKQNNGFINVYSEPRQGTAFKIYLPRYMDEGAETADDKLEPKVRGGTETILVVEDSEPVLNLCKAMLESLGYQVLTARGKDQAFQRISEYHESIDLLLTDVVMPEMNGKELSQRIMAVKPALKCLYMSGYTADVIARQGVLDEGINFISKPFSLKDLAAKVREVLGA